ncbi:unnamed protein product [Prunus brigantina]
MLIQKSESKSRIPSTMAEVAKKYAVVTGSNQGIGFGIVRKLASNGIMVVLTALDEKMGVEAIEKLKESGLSDLVVFHQLDVTDTASIASLADFVKNQFGKLDILVNNAGVSGTIVDPESMRAAAAAGIGKDGVGVNWSEIMTQTYELAEVCVKTNYYGAKKMTKALLPLLQLSDSPRVVSLSSSMGSLKHIPNEWAKGMLSDAEKLTEQRIDDVLNEFLKDFKEDILETKGWPTSLSAYILSKAAVNAFTRMMANKYPNICINSVNPGFVKTDMNFNTGMLTIDEGAESVVRLAMVPNGSPSGLYFYLQELKPQRGRVLNKNKLLTSSNKGIGFGTVRQLASNGVTVVLTARDKKRGLEAVEQLKELGLSDVLVVFHQLDVTDPVSIASLADFVKTQFGKLDILVNNAGIIGSQLNPEAFRSAVSGKKAEEIDWSEVSTTLNYELAEECLETNYYGTKRVTEALLPILQLSDSPRIVNVSSRFAKLMMQRFLFPNQIKTLLFFMLLQNFPNGWAK